MGALAQMLDDDQFLAASEFTLLIGDQLIGRGAGEAVQFGSHDGLECGQHLRLAGAGRTAADMLNHGLIRRTVHVGHQITLLNL